MDNEIGITDKQKKKIIKVGAIAVVALVAWGWLAGDWFEPNQYKSFDDCYMPLMKAVNGCSKLSKCEPSQDGFDYIKRGKIGRFGKERILSVAFSTDTEEEMIARVNYLKSIPSGLGAKCSLSGHFAIVTGANGANKFIDATGFDFTQTNSGAVKFASNQTGYTFFINFNPYVQRYSKKSDRVSAVNPSIFSFDPYR